MTEEEKKQLQEEYSKKTFGGLLLELARLILILVIKVTIKSAKLVVKFLLLVIELAQKGWERLVEWWNDNDTQEKVAKIKATLKAWSIKFGEWCVIAGVAIAKGVKIGSIAVWHGIVKGTKATGKGIVIGVAATIQGIIHLKPTVIKLAQLTVKGGKAFVAWTKRCRRGMRLSSIRRKRAYERFNRNGGMKGAVARSTAAVSNSVRTFMEEDQDEAAPDAVTEDDILEEEIEEYSTEGNKAQQIGKKIFTKAKTIMDVD